MKGLELHPKMDARVTAHTRRGGDPDIAVAGLKDVTDVRVGKVVANLPALNDEGTQLRRQVAIINSMTPGERRFPKTINGSRKRRIAAGCGLQIQDVNRLLKQYTQMERMMRKVSRGGMKNMLRGMPGGRLPPGMR